MGMQRGEEWTEKLVACDELDRRTKIFNFRNKMFYFDVD